MKRTTKCQAALGTLCLFAIVATSIFSEQATVSASPLNQKPASAIQSETSDEEIARLTRKLCSQLEDVAPMSPRRIREVVNHAQRCHRAVIFVNHEWSLTSVAFRPRYVNAMVVSAFRHPKSTVAFHYVDGSERQCDAIRELSGFHQHAAGRFNPNNGNGEIIWLENGQVIGAKNILSFSNGEELASFTMELFHQRR